MAAVKFARPGASPAARTSRTPVARHSSPSGSSARACCSVARTPARDRRDSRLSSGEKCGASMPTGSPDAPAAGRSAASSTVTAQPRRDRLAAAAAPASPAPITTQRPARTSTTGCRRRGSHAGSNTPCRQWRLGGSPSTFSSAKPHCVRLRRTSPATVHVASVAPRRQRRATALIVPKLPHRGVLDGIEAVKKDAVRVERLFTQRVAHVADEQRQQDVPLLEHQPVHARRQAEPLGRQLAGERHQLGVTPTRRAKGRRRRQATLRPTRNAAARSAAGPPSMLAMRRGS